MPRFHLKTTVGTISGVIFEIVKDPNIRILLGNEVKEGAESFLQEVSNHFQLNEVFRAFFPEVIPENFKKTIWNKGQILVPRTALWREPTVDTIGVGGTKVGMHYDLLQFDDLIGLGSLDSPTEMRKAIRWLNYTRGLQVSAYTTRTNLIGTRWSLADVYSHAIENLNFVEFRRGALVMGPNGPEPFFPEKMSMQMLEEIIVSDPFQWATNFANNPYDASTSDFDPEWLKTQYFYFAPDGEIRYKDWNGDLAYQKLSDLRVYLHIDPSLGERDDSDETAFVLVGLNSKGQIFVLDSWKKRIDPIATLDNLFDYQEQYAPSLTTVEGVAYQKALKYFAEDRAKRERRYLNIESYMPGNKRDKLTRIRMTLQPYFRDRRIFIRSNAFQFIDEYNTFGRSHPDILDALAQGPSVWKYPADPKTVQKRDSVKQSYVRSGSTGYGQ